MKRLKKILPGIEENIPLGEHTTFKIGGPAKYFYEAKNEKEIIKALRSAKEAGVEFFVLGGGSNLLVADKGFDGLVIKTKNDWAKTDGEMIVAGSGAKLKQILEIALKNSLAGFEWAAGIPGTLGGAIRGNAGAFGSWMSQAVETVTAYDLEKEKIIKLNNSQCLFGHKMSIFKKNPNLVILSAAIKLKKGPKEKSREIVEEHLALRKNKHPLDLPSAGCIFENCLVDDKSFSSLPESFSAFKGKGTLPTGFLVEEAGLKGLNFGGAKISDKHANFIVNFKRAEAKDVVELIKKVKKEIKEKFGIELKEEIYYLGFDNRH